ncbi:MAG: DUF2975 domain-containing protein [Firmicutes bacterium]|nr:DUF2975 domain-containing protein [Bacillota bacterium]
MDQKKLARWLKVIIIGVGICGLVVFLLIVPAYGQSIAYDYPEFAYCYWPWLIFLWVAALPCYAALVLAWKVAVNIGNDRSFSVENANLLRKVSYLAAGDSAFFFVGNVVLLFMSMSHPGITLMSLIVVFFGIAVAVASAALSHLITKAAVLQEDSDLTI